MTDVKPKSVIPPTDNLTYLYALSFPDSYLGAPICYKTDSDAIDAVVRQYQQLLCFLVSEDDSKPVSLRAIAASSDFFSNCELFRIGTFDTVTGELVSDIHKISIVDPDGEPLLPLIYDRFVQNLEKRGEIE